MTEAGASAACPAGLPRRGRQLDESRAGAIRCAALDLLAECGYDRLTMEAVAARAGAGKGALYRRWSSKADLVVDAMRAMKPTSRDCPDTGSLRGDLEASVRDAFGDIDDFRARVMTGLATALHRHPDLARTFREQFVAQRAALIRVVFARAVARGEIAPERDLEMLALVVPAMVFHRLLLTTQPVDAEYLHRVLTAVVLPLATAPTPPSS